MSKRSRRGFAVPSGSERAQKLDAAGAASVPCPATSAPAPPPPPRAVPLRESATAAAFRIAEASGGKVKATGKANRYRARLIEGDRWGSSGYYPRKVLERDGAKAWPEGTLCFLDHPTATEEADRPERSVRDLGAKIISTPVYESDGLYADIEVFPHAADLVEALADTIGLSVRGEGTAEFGEAAGRSGLIVESIERGYSVDFVTKAGAGGKVVSLLESARKLGLRETATDVTRQALCDALEEQYANTRRGIYVWVRDFDPDKRVVYYSVSTNGDTDTWQQTYDITSDPAPLVTLTGKATQVVAQTAYVPVADPDDPGEQPGDDALVEASRPPAAVPVKETVTAGTPPAAPSPSNERSAAVTAPNQTGQAPGAAGTTVVLGEAERLSQLLAESRTNLAEANAARDKAEARATTAEKRATLIEAQRGAEKQVVAKLRDSDLKEASWPAVVARVCDSLELTEAGKVDEAKLTTAIGAEIQAERTNVARLLESYGVGTVSGLGQTGGKEQLSEADFEKDMADVFTSIGLSEAESKTAAKGRG